MYTSCLRRKDGFELPAVEGLLCNSRPIVYDAPRYRQWFDGLAEFIPEEDPEKVINNLVRLFQKSYKPVTEEERNETLKRFNWETIIKGFWNRVV
jgi:glycosyltransferase involved in cell wall biosynthesis